MVSMKTVFEYALWLAQTSVFKICCQMFNHIIQITFSPMTNVLKRCKIETNARSSNRFSVPYSKPKGQRFERK